MNKAVNNLTASLLGILFFLSFSFCSAQTINSPFNGRPLKTGKEIGNYSFMVAGHLYGAPETWGSVFPASSILANLDMINTSGAAFFVLLGDNYREASPIHILNLKKGFTSRIAMPVFNSASNHDLTNRSLYEENFGTTYFDFICGNGLFVFLDTELDSGEIKGKQLEYFHNVLGHGDMNPGLKNVFIFSHKLIWSAHNPDYQIVFDNLNNQAGYPVTSHNFKNDIEPYLMKLSSNNKAVYWFSGDIGTSWSNTLFYRKDSGYNITYMATGIGDTLRDLILRVSVHKSGEVIFTPISLTGQRLQPIEYYNIDYWKNYFHKNGYSQGLIKKVLIILKHKYFLSGALSALSFSALLSFIFKYKRRRNNSIKSL